TQLQQPTKSGGRSALGQRLPYRLYLLYVGLALNLTLSHVVGERRRLGHHACQTPSVETTSASLPCGVRPAGDRAAPCPHSLAFARPNRATLWAWPSESQRARGARPSIGPTGQTLQHETWASRNVQRTCSERPQSPLHGASESTASDRAPPKYSSECR